MPLEPGLRRPAARAMTAAFVDDPVWIAIGPRRRAARARMLRRYYGIALAEALRFGGPSWCAVRSGSVLGVAITFRHGERFPPPRAGVVEAPPFLLAGPAPAGRAAQVTRVMERKHPAEPHLYLWFLAAHPAVQRQGVGRALMASVLSEAAARGAPVYLETTREENVPYYAGFGFRVTDHAPLVRAARMWFMWREPE